jgi:hypothetical protein
VTEGNKKKHPQYKHHILLQNQDDNKRRPASGQTVMMETALKGARVTINNTLGEGFFVASSCGSDVALLKN